MPDSDLTVAPAPVAAIGIGSNSVRLLVARQAGGRLSALERLETVTRLGALLPGPGDAPLLDEDAVRESRAIAGRFARHARERGARLLAAIATEAARIAANRSLLLDGLEDALAAPVVVISREEEVELGWRAAATDCAPETDLGVIDMGGGSTGLSTGKAGLRAPAELLGLGVGGHNVAAMHGLAHPVSRNDMAGALAAIAAQVGPQAAAMKTRPAMGVVIGGTATVLAAARRVSPAGDGDPAGTSDFTAADWLERWLYRVAPLDSAARAAAGVPADRVDIVVAGGAILLAVLRAWGLDGFYASPRTILDGFIERSLQADGTS